MNRKPRDIVFRPRFNGEAGFFALKDRAELVDRIADALSTAKTWREFRDLLPAGEFERLPNWASGYGDQFYYDGERYLFVDPEYLAECLEDGEDYVINATDAFEPSGVSGFDEGDYPPFLEPEQDGLLPDEFCDAYGTRVDSFLNGSWWQFPLERFDEMKAVLENRGFSVMRQK